jgi:hypothetical protein
MVMVMVAVMVMGATYQQQQIFFSHIESTYCTSTVADSLTRGEKSLGNSYVALGREPLPNLFPHNFGTSPEITTWYLASSLQ